MQSGNRQSEIAVFQNDPATCQVSTNAWFLYFVHADLPYAAFMKSSQLVRNYYVLPCCLLLLNLCVELASYKAKMIDDPLLRTGAIMGMVLFGGSLVAFLVAPGISLFVG